MVTNMIHNFQEGYPKELFYLKHLLYLDNVLRVMNYRITYKLCILEQETTLFTKVLSLVKIESTATNQCELVTLQH